MFDATCHPFINHQHVTWNIPITGPSAAFHASTASGVGRRSVWHPFFWKNLAASSDSSSNPLWPVPMISRLAPSLNMCCASSSETLCEVPYLSFESLFFRFFTRPLKRITTSCSYSSPDMVMLPNSVLSIDGFISPPLFNHHYQPFSPY